MSISDLHSYGEPHDVVADAVAQLRGIAETMWAARSDDDLVATVEHLQQLKSVVAAVEAGAVAEVDARGVARDKLHHGSTGDWLTHLGGLGKGAGKRLVVRAKALTGPLAATREGLAVGTVSPEQADIIVASIDALPSSPVTRARGEETLLVHAVGFDASDLGRLGRRLVHVVDPDAEDRRLERALAREERAAHTGRFLSIATDGAGGGVRVNGRGSAEDGALLKAALLPLTCPEPTVDDGQGDPTRDPREAGARLWDALVQTAQHALDTELPPECHGARPRLAVTMDLASLKSALSEHAAGVGVTDDGTELSAEAVRRLACDAEVIPAVLGSRSEVLDVDRMRRLVTSAIWIALVVRDRHCAFPGCQRPPMMCHAHHVIHWILGGKTKLANLVLLCGHHHRVIHHSPWDVRINPNDHRPEFLPPSKPGMPGEWIRHRPRRE
jgi:hypothetical protein